MRSRRWPVLLALVTLGSSLAAAHPAGAAPAGQPQAAPPQAAQPSPPPGVLPGDAFGEEVTMAEKTIIYFSGTGTWDTAFDTILDAFKTLSAYVDRQGIRPAGPSMTIYTATDDAGFQFQAAVPIEAAPANPPQGDLAVGKSPGGKAYKFVHRGSYDSMDATYEAIANFLDERSIDAKDLFVEEYVTDPLKTAEDQLVIEVYVPVK